MSKFNTFKATAAGREETLRRREVRKMKTGGIPVIRHAHERKGN